MYIFNFLSLQEPQKEQSHLMWPDGTIEKWVVVHLKCKVSIRI